MSVVAGCEIACVGEYFLADISCSEAAVENAAGKDSAVDFETAAVVVGEQLVVAFLASAFEYWQKYWKTPPAPLNLQLNSVKPQRCSECSANWNSGQHLVCYSVVNHQQKAVRMLN